MTDMTPAKRSLLRNRAEGLAVGLPPLLVSAERVAATVLQGVHGRRRVGQGETFWQYRPYGPSDSAAQIDWRQSARSRHVYVRETEWEAAQTVWLWADSSDSMEYRSLPTLPTKLERAQLLLLALAFMLMRGGERFALLGSGSAPSTGRAALYRVTDSLIYDATDMANLPTADSLPRSAQVVIIGDFLETISHVREAVLGLAAQGLGGQIVHLLDPAEIELPFAGRVRFQGAEGEDDSLVNHVEAVRPDYQSRIEGHQAAIREIAQTAGWGVIAHRTDTTAESCLLSLYLALALKIGR